MRDTLPSVPNKVVALAFAVVAITSAACAGGDGTDESRAAAPAQSGAADTLATPTPSPTPSPEPTPLRPSELLAVAPDFSLPSANSAAVTLSELTAEQPVVLVFYRAFW